MSAPETPHDWRDLAFWRAELRRKPPEELALAAALWRWAVIFQWIEAAGGSLCCTDGCVLLPELTPCPAARALRYAVRELEDRL
jgi:hypothetical protein